MLFPRPHLAEFLQKNKVYAKRYFDVGLWTVYRKNKAGRVGEFLKPCDQSTRKMQIQGWGDLTHPPTHSLAHLSIILPIHLSIYQFSLSPSIHLSTIPCIPSPSFLSPFINLSIYRSTHQSIVDFFHPSTPSPSVHLSIYLSIIEWLSEPIYHLSIHPEEALFDHWIRQVNPFARRLLSELSRFLWNHGTH